MRYLGEDIQDHSDIRTVVFGVPEKSAQILLLLSSMTLLALQTNITIPVKPHQKIYRQIEADSYSYDKLNDNKKFNIVLSTTTLDFSVTEVLFNIINRTFNTKQTKAESEFDCAKREIAKDTTLKFNGQTVVIPGSIYADQVRDKCYLRLRPSKNDEWVLGLQFYYAYAARFGGNKKSVQFNKSLYGEFTD